MQNVIDIWTSLNLRRRVIIVGATLQKPPMQTSLGLQQSLACVQAVPGALVKVAASVLGATTCVRVMWPPERRDRASAPSSVRVSTS